MPASQARRRIGRRIRAAVSGMTSGPAHPSPIVFDVHETTVRWLMSSHGKDSPMTINDLMRRPHWQRWAACRGAGTRDFFSSGTDQALAVCTGCPVRTDCLAFALADQNVVGVWGGTSTKERKAMLRGVA